MRQFRCTLFNIRAILLLRDLSDKLLDDSIVSNTLNLACEKSNKPLTNSILKHGDSTPIVEWFYNPFWKQ